MIRELKFFSKDINKLYQDELELIIAKANNHNINHVEFDWHIDNEAIKIMGDFWTWPNLKFATGSIEKDSGSNYHERENANKYLGKTIASAGENVKLYYAKYKLPLFFDKDKTIDYGEPSYSISCFGELDRQQPTVYFFTENQLDDNEAAIIKAKRETLVQKIQAGIANNAKFRDSKASEAAIEVTKILHNRFEDLKAKRDINSKL